MSTRLTPRALEKHEELIAGVKEEELLAMHKDDASQFLKNQGIKGTRAEIEAVCKPYGYHPLTLSILAGFILGNRENPNDISVARELNITDDIIQNKTHVLEVAYNSLVPEESKLLSIIACFRSPTSYDALKSIETNPPLPSGRGARGEGKSQGENEREKLNATLQTLEQRGLLHWDKSTNKYDYTPLCAATPTNA